MLLWIYDTARNEKVCRMNVFNNTFLYLCLWNNNLKLWSLQTANLIPFTSQATFLTSTKETSYIRLTEYSVTRQTGSKRIMSGRELFHARTNMSWQVSFQSGQGIICQTRNITASNKGKKKQQSNWYTTICNVSQFFWFLTKYPIFALVLLELTPF